jgi:hypothetical protein
MISTAGTGKRDMQLGAAAAENENKNRLSERNSFKGPLT